MTPAQIEARRAGGKAVGSKTPPACCPHCGRSMAGRSWYSWLGHLGLHGLARRYFEGDVEAAQRRLRENGQARQDPAAWNRAFARYRPVTNGAINAPTETPF